MVLTDMLHEMWQIRKDFGLGIWPDAIPDTRIIRRLLKKERLVWVHGRVR